MRRFSRNFLLTLTLAVSFIITSYYVLSNNNNNDVAGRPLPYLVQQLPAEVAQEAYGPAPLPYMVRHPGAESHAHKVSAYQEKETTPRLSRLRPATTGRYSPRTTSQAPYPEAPFTQTSPSPGTSTPRPSSSDLRSKVSPQTDDVDGQDALHAAPSGASAPARVSGNAVPADDQHAVPEGQCCPPVGRADHEDLNPSPRSHPDQVYVFHNHESQLPSWIRIPSFRRPSWRSAFNWTMTYRADSDIQGLYGYMARRDRPVVKNYTAVLARKTKLAAQLVSNCHTYGRREEYVKRVQKLAPVDVYGGCHSLKCPRNSDDACFKLLSSQYKFFFSFENAFCKDYISEKFFRYMEGDFVVVARGSNQYKDHAPPGTFINTADFKSPEDLARHLLFLDSHPEEYLKILKAKDAYRPLYEDWPIRNAKGEVVFMTYHYQAVGFCEMCRRLWELDDYRQTVPDIVKWFDKENCYPPNDLS